VEFKALKTPIPPIPFPMRFGRIQYSSVNEIVYRKNDVPDKLFLKLGFKYYGFELLNYYGLNIVSTEFLEDGTVLA
jgi:hypothetical protein